MNLSIRKARESDRKRFDWPYRTADGVFKPWVVAVDGEPFVFFGSDRTIIWQNGGESVADLVRIAIRYFDAMQQVGYDLSDVRTTRSMERSRERVREAMRNV